MTSVKIVVGIIGIFTVVAIWRDVIDTVITTRHGQRWSAARRFYRITWRAYRAAAKRIDDPARRERFLVPYGPVSFVGLLAVWVALLVFGWGLIWWGLQNHIDGIDGVVSAIYFSGVTFLTIGFGDIVPLGDGSRLLAVVEGLNGILTTALVIGLLPTLFGAYNRRESMLLTLDTLDGQVTPLAYLRFYADGGDLSPLYTQFQEWETWCADVFDSHTSYPMLLWFRSRQPGRSWTVGLAVVLESASYVMSTIEGARHHEAQLLYRRGGHASRFRSIRLSICIRTRCSNSTRRRCAPSSSGSTPQSSSSVSPRGRSKRPTQREQALRADYLPALLQLNWALLAPFEFRTHARPIPVEMD